MKKNVLGVNIDDITLDEALAQTFELVKAPGKHLIVTPNPEFLLAAQEDAEFTKILNEADLAIPDGAGLKLSGKVANIVPGTDLMEKIIAKSATQGLTVGLLGGRKGVAESLKECLLEKYSSLKIVICEGDVEVNAGGEALYKDLKDGYVQNAPETGSYRSKINQNSVSTYKLDDQNTSDFPKELSTPVDFLFVAFGQVKQEKWIIKNKASLNFKVAMGVGGAFDYLSGNVPRAPLFMRNMGLEWLFRLIVQPWRIFRILSLIRYLWLISLNK